MQTRTPALVVVFTIITIGFYGLYWMLSTQSVLNRKTGMGSSGGLTFLFMLLTCGLYTFYWWYILGKEIRKVGGREDRSVLYLVLALFGFSIVSFAVAQSDINDILENGDDDDDDDDDDE